MTFSQLIGVMFLLVSVCLFLCNRSIAKLEKRIEELERKKEEG